MKKTFKGVLIGLFLLSINLFGITIDTRNPDISYKKDKNNIIWTEGTGIQDQYKDYWRDYLDETEGWVDPYFVLSGLEVTSYVKYNDGREVGNHGELRDILINAEYDLQNFVRIEGTSAPIPGDRYNRTIQFKLIDEETGEIGFIFSIRNIKLLPYANISWDLDSAEIVNPEGDVLEGPDAILYFSNVIRYLYQKKNNY
jgi:hypothetical protein